MKISLFVFLCLIASDLFASATLFAYRGGVGCIDEQSNHGWNQGELGECGKIDNAQLYGANLSGLNLRGISLIEANLGKANLQKADLRGADLTDANIFQKADFTGALFNEDTKLPVPTEVAVKDLKMVFLSLKDSTNKLRQAIYKKNVAAAKDAIKDFANVNDYNVLTDAFDRMNLEILELLFANGADLKGYFSIRDTSGKEREQYNVTFGKIFTNYVHHEDNKLRLAVFELLLKNGAALTQSFSAQQHEPILGLLNVIEDDYAISLYRIAQKYGQMTPEFLNNFSHWRNDLCWYQQIPIWNTASHALILEMIKDGVLLSGPINYPKDQHSSYYYKCDKFDFSSILAWNLFGRGGLIESFPKSIYETAMVVGIPTAAIGPNKFKSFLTSLHFWKEQGLDFFASASTNGDEFNLSYEIFTRLLEDHNLKPYKYGGFVITKGPDNAIAFLEELKKLGYDVLKLQNGYNFLHLIVAPDGPDSSIWSYYSDFDQRSPLSRENELYVSNLFRKMLDLGFQLNAKTASGDTIAHLLFRKPDAAHKSILGGTDFSTGKRMVDYENFNGDKYVEKLVGILNLCPDQSQCDFSIDWNAVSNKDGATPLTLAVQAYTDRRISCYTGGFSPNHNCSNVLNYKDGIQIIKRLLELGANKNLRDGSGKLPIDYCSTGNGGTICRELLK